jgi:hypothetical protein
MGRKSKRCSSHVSVEIPSVSNSDVSKCSVHPIIRVRENNDMVEFERRQPAEFERRQPDLDGQQSVQESFDNDENHRSQYERLSESVKDSLTQQQIEHFISEGYVLLKSAFSREAATKARAFLWDRIGQDGIKADDPTTWVRRHGIAESYWPSSEPWDEVITSKLYKAIDQLCGENNSRSFGCGWWVVSFPDQVEPPWGIDGNWHVDGYGYRHFVDSPEIGVMPIFLFNDLGAEDGGTVLCRGSHKAVR